MAITKPEPVIHLVWDPTAHISVCGMCRRVDRLTMNPLYTSCVRCLRLVSTRLDRRITKDVALFLKAQQRLKVLV